MASRIFIVGIDDYDEVLAIRTEALLALRNGGVSISSWTSEGTSVTKIQGLSLNRILEETVLFILESKGRRITRTSPAFLM
jgi:hypothetical protein